MPQLDQIVSLAELLVQQKAKFEDLEQQAKDAKKAWMRTEQDDLPAAMMEAGLQEIALKDGARIQLKEDCKAAITEKTRGPALAWLLANNFGGLIKTNVTVEFGRGERDQAEAARAALEARYPGVVIKEDVHASTLKAFVKEQMASGNAIPMDLFNVHPFTKAVITKR